LSRLSLAFRSFFSLLSSGKLPDDIVVELGLVRRIAVPATPGATGPKPESSRQSAESPRAGDGAIQLLAMLQQESRIVDFLMEDITPYSDEQVGQVMRSVHENCRKVLDRVMTLTPIVDGVENTATNIAAQGLSNKQKQRIKLLGKVPPDGKAETGILRHRGWQVEKVNLPSLAPGDRASVIAPAEIEVE
jgi:hypothetical protein